MAVPKPFVGAAIATSLVLAVPMIADYEGKRNDPYKDLAGIQTVCYGETRVPMRRYTDEECTQMLNKAVGEFAAKVVEATPILANRPIQLAAATSLAYNIGIRAYSKSTVARRFNAGDIKGGCEAFKMWNKVNGRVVAGLVKRREMEYKLCVTYA